MEEEQAENERKAREEGEGDGEEQQLKPIDIDSVMCDFDSQMNYISGHYCGSDSSSSEGEGEEEEELNRTLLQYSNGSSFNLNGSTSSRSNLVPTNGQGEGGEGSDEHSFSARSFNIVH